MPGVQLTAFSCTGPTICPALLAWPSVCEDKADADAEAGGSSRLRRVAAGLEHHVAAEHDCSPGESERESVKCS